MKETTFTLACLACSIDGKSIISTAHAEKVYAVRAIEALDPTVAPRDALLALRALRDAAREIGSNDLAEVLTAALALRREVTVGGKPRASANTVVSALDRWLVEVPDTRWTW